MLRKLEKLKKLRKHSALDSTVMQTWCWRSLYHYPTYATLKKKCTWLEANRGELRAIPRDIQEALLLQQAEEAAHKGDAPPPEARRETTDERNARAWVETIQPLLIWLFRKAIRLAMKKKPLRKFAFYSGSRSITFSLDAQGEKEGVRLAWDIHGSRYGGQKRFSAESVEALALKLVAHFKPILLDRARLDPDRIRLLMSWAYLARPNIWTRCELPQFVDLKKIEIEPLTAPKAS